jgi:chaperonin GroEL
VISEDIGVKLENVTVNELGRAKRVTIDKNDTTIVEGTGSKSAIEGRVRQLRTQIEETTSDYDREKLQERLAKIVGGVAVINMGAATETEMKERKARVEDALNATKAAVEEGVIVGGGVAFVRCIPGLEKLKLAGDEQFGVNIVKRTLEEPLRQIAENAGHDGSVVVEEVKAEKGNLGFNADTEKYEDLMNAGIIDPTKVARLALQNAASVAALLLTTDAVVTEKPKKKEGRYPYPQAAEDMY